LEVLANHLGFDDGFDPTVFARPNSQQADMAQARRENECAH
jgi:hypothetical protein